MVPKKLMELAIVLTVAFVLVYMASGADEETSHDTTSSHTDDLDSTHDTTSSHADDHDSTHDTSHSSSVDLNVFVLGSYFDYDVFIILLSAVGGSAMIFEFILNKYENWIKKEGDQFQSTLYDKIVRELMTLGVVSFVLFLLQPVVNTGTLFVIFEFTHYVVFFVAIFAVFQLVLLGASTYPIKRSWDVAAYKSKDELIEGYQSMVSHLRKWSVPVPLLGCVSLDVFHWSHHWRWIDRVEYHLARSVFIRQHRRSADFDFARYAVMVTNRQILSMANFSFSNWLVLILLHWLYCGLGQIGSPKEKENIGFVSWFVVGMILCGLELALLYACMIGMKRICVKLGADPSDPFGTLDVVLDKIWVVPVTHVQHRRLNNDNSVKDSLPGMAMLHEEKTMEDAKQAQAPVTTDFLKKDHDGVGNGVEVSKLAAIPRITMKDAFVLPSRSMYGTAVELLMLLNSYYLAVYAVYFISPASKSSTAWFWIVLLPLPIAGGVLMAYRRVIPLIALLSSIVMLHSSDVADVEQETEDLSKLRRKLVMRVEDVLEQEYHKTVADGGEKALDGLTPAGFLLKRWDTDGNGTLSYDELQKGLGAIGLVLSNRQRKELLRLADPDRNGCIDIGELTDLLFDVSVEMAVAAAEASEAGESSDKYTTLKLLLRHSVGGGMENEVNERVERLLLRRTHSSKLP